MQDFLNAEVCDFILIIDVFDNQQTRLYVTESAKTGFIYTSKYTHLMSHNFSYVLF